LIPYKYGEFKLTQVVEDLDLRVELTGQIEESKGEIEATVYSSDHSSITIKNSFVTDSQSVQIVDGRPVVNSINLVPSTEMTVRLPGNAKADRFGIFPRFLMSIEPFVGQ